MDFDSIIEQLKSEYIGYASTYRYSDQPEKIKHARAKKISFHYDDEIIRESLLEHVGHLPITAIVLYPYLNDSTVNLGDVLTMLAIHDIGETELGDVNVFSKNSKTEEEEKEMGLKLLHKSYHELYLDVEEQRTSSGKFAKSIDKIVPEILEFFAPTELTFQRYESVGISKDEIIKRKSEKKIPLMKWNPFLSEFYPFLLEKLQKRLNED